jgi:thiol-disulfide isomerase/thioredoxin
LTDEQISQLQIIHRQSQTRLQQVANDQSAHEPGWAQKRTKLILQQKSQKIVDALTADQHQQWTVLLGDLFDFSKTAPVFFHAPELTNVTEWINTEPLTMQDLRGRVVVVHFWTFGCGNCIQNYPVYKQWTKQYDSKEVFMLGIHTPEAKYEKDIETLRERMAQEGLSFAVAVDNNKANWNGWFNRMWPSVYLVDKNGRVRYWWYGELRWQGATGDQWIAQRIEELRAE